MEQITAIIPVSKTVVNAVETIAPGMLDAHYAPNKKMILASLDQPLNIPFEQAGLISFTGIQTEKFKKVIRVSEHADLKEYAIHLFAAMHDMDASDVQLIVAEAVPEIGIGAAIMDRLKKAVHKFNQPR